MQTSLTPEEYSSLLSSLNVDDSPIEQIVYGKPFTTRAVASLIDYAVIYVMHFVITLIALLLVHFIVGLYGQSTGLGFVIVSSPRVLDYIMGFVLLLSYMTVFIWLAGSTPGKLILKMRVVSEQGEKARFIAALQRSIALFFDTLFLAIPAYLKMKPPLYQRYGDIFANTIVVDIKDPVIKSTYKKRWFLLSSAIFVVIVIIAAIMQAAYTIGPFTPLVKIPAAEINLQITDFPKNFIQKNVVAIPSTDINLTDKNTHNFADSDNSIYSYVWIYNHFLHETDASLKTAIATILKKLFPDPQLSIMPQVEYTFGNPVLIEKFTDEKQNIEGYSLFIVKKNVAIRTDLFGKPGSISLEDVQQLATIMLNRIP
jgi:uncharacterized RDD family membrane protein YckC